MSGGAMRSINRRVAAPSVQSSPFEFPALPQLFLLWTIFTMLVSVRIHAQAAPAQSVSGTATLSQHHQAVAEDFGKLPLSFEANQGQSARPVKFLARGDGYALSLTGSSALLSLSRPHPEP